jgi:hypothetical protein
MRETRDLQRGENRGESALLISRASCAAHDSSERKHLLIIGRHLKNRCVRFGFDDICKLPDDARGLRSSDGKQEFLVKISCLRTVFADHQPLFAEPAIDRFLALFCARGEWPAWVLRIKHLVCQNSLGCRIGFSIFMEVLIPLPSGPNNVTKFSARVDNGCGEGTWA